MLRQALVWEKQLRGELRQCFVFFFLLFSQILRCFLSLKLASKNTWLPRSASLNTVCFLAVMCWLAGKLCWLAVLLAGWLVGVSESVSSPHIPSASYTLHSNPSCECRGDTHEDSHKRLMLGYLKQYMVTIKHELHYATMRRNITNCTRKMNCFIWMFAGTV